MIPLKGNVRSRGLRLATLGLLTANIAVFVAQASLEESALVAFVQQWGVVPAREIALMESGPAGVAGWLPPLTSAMFLHGGLLHLAGNLLFLWVFGGAVEGRLGARRFVELYIVCGLFASLAHLAMNPTGTIPLVGASGAIAGVLGAYLALYPRSTLEVVIPVVIIPFFRKVSAWLFLLVWLGHQVLAGTLSELSPQQGGGVAWWAHVGGFVAGFVMLPLMTWRAGRR